jgi:hypothetical protein
MLSPRVAPLVIETPVENSAQIEAPLEKLIPSRLIHAETRRYPGDKTKYINYHVLEHIDTDHIEFIAYDYDLNLEFEHVYLSKMALLTKLEVKAQEQFAEKLRELIVIREKLPPNTDYTDQDALLLKDIRFKLIGEYLVSHAVVIPEGQPPGRVILIESDDAGTHTPVTSYYSPEKPTGRADTFIDRKKLHSLPTTTKTPGSSVKGERHRRHTVKDVMIEHAVSALESLFGGGNTNEGENRTQGSGRVSAYSSTDTPTQRTRRRTADFTQPAQTSFVPTSTVRKSSDKYDLDDSSSVNVRRKSRGQVKDGMVAHAVEVVSTAVSGAISSLTSPRVNPSDALLTDVQVTSSTEEKNRNASESTKSLNST